tara:strand:- start:682 stop:2199 length:1518 start_codon:yes stop_codon:yes gene_type:complete
MKYGTISTGSIEGLETAKHIFDAGGNAFDAAIATVFTSMTSEFALTGAAGGGTLIASIKNSAPIVYDFFVDSPKINSKNTNFKKIHVEFEDTSQAFYIGKGSIAIPGNIAGLLDVHQAHGKLPLNVILEPAIDIAKNGIILSSYQAYINSLIKPILLHTNQGKKLFTINDDFLQQGDKFKNPSFADFLFCLSKEGKNLFYIGDGAALIEKYFAKEGNITRSALKNYKVFKREALQCTINNYSLFTNPAPSHGGTLITFLLKLLMQTNQLNSKILNLVKSMELTTHARNEFCKDINDEFEINNILNNNILNKYIKLFKTNNYNKLIQDLNGFGSTTHTSIIDKKGNAVSVTTTNGEGSGHFIPEMGIMMNNMLGEEDLNPYGFHKWEKSRRLPTMISPTLIYKDNNLKYALGSGGSNRIRSAISQVVINLLINKLSLKNAIHHPRMHIENNTIFTEPGLNLEAVKHLKHLNFQTFKNQNVFFGGVNAVGLSEAVGDLRRGGIGEIY